MTPYPLDTVLSRLEEQQGSRPSGPGSTRVPCPISHFAVHEVDAIAVQFDTGVDNGSWSYSELNRRVEEMIAIYRREGLGDGDTVALYRCAPEDVICWLFAGFRVGIRTLVLSPRLPEVALPDRLGDAGAMCLVAPDPAPEGVRWIATDSEAQTVGRTDIDARPTETVHGEATIAADCLATLLFTSGSAGSPKIVAHTFSNHLFSAAGMLDRISLAPGDSWLLSLGLHHVGGLAILIRCFLAGATVRISGSGLDDDLSGITHLSLVSTQLRRVLSGGASWLSDVREIIVGGGPVPDELLVRCLDAQLPVRVTYGSTEMASMVTLTDGPTHTSGSILRYREMRNSETGEILVRGQTLFPGYLVDGVLEKALDANGWFPTRDTGAIQDGELVVRGRLDNQFISGGENIQPEEIERQLLGIPGIVDAVVVPVESAEYGRRPVAFICRESKVPSNEEINRLLRERLASYNVPDAYLGWPEHESSEAKLSRAGFIDLAESLGGKAQPEG